MYKVEFIHKKSTYADIIDNWLALGKSNDSEHGFVFDDLPLFPEIDGGVIRIYANDKWYFYNMSDFYRVKVTEI